MTEQAPEKSPEEIAADAVAAAAVAAGEPQEKAPDAPVVEVAKDPDPALEPAADDQAALQAAADEDGLLAPEVEAVPSNPNALRGVPAGPRPHPRNR